MVIRLASKYSFPPFRDSSLYCPSAPGSDLRPLHYCVFEWVWVFFFFFFLFLVFFLELVAIHLLVSSFFSRAGKGRLCHSIKLATNPFISLLCPGEARWSFLIPYLPEFSFCRTPCTFPSPFFTERSSEERPPL